MCEVVCVVDWAAVVRAVRRFPLKMERPTRAAVPVADTWKALAVPVAVQEW